MIRGENKIQRVGFVYLSLISLIRLKALPKEVFITKFKFAAESALVRSKLGLEYLCASLRLGGTESKIYDQQLTDFCQERLICLLKKDKIDLIGFYTTSDNLEAVVVFCRKVKRELRIPVIAGGPGCIHFKRLIEAGCEIVCLGEADETIREVVDYYEGRKRLEGISGISFLNKETGEITTNPHRPLIEPVDRLPFPERDSRKIKRSRSYFWLPNKRPFVSILASRGCIYRCAFCGSHLFWQGKHRQRSVGNVIEELKQVSSENGVKYIRFEDDVFAADFNWLKEFCEELKKEKLRLGWMCNLHPLSFRKRKEEAFLMMAETGCNFLLFGAQSVNPQVLKNINRSPEEPDELASSIFIAKELGITTEVDYIFGLPGDTTKTLQENFEFCLKVKPHLVNFHPLGVLPGSKIAIEYSGRAICELSKAEIESLCKKYMLQYYLRRDVAVQLIRDILDKNPASFLNLVPLALRFLPPFFKHP